MVAKATVMQFHLFKDAKDPFCGLAAARGASWVFFLLLSLFLFVGLGGWGFHRFFCYGVGWASVLAAAPRLEGNCVAVSRHHLDGDAVICCGYRRRG